MRLPRRHRRSLTGDVGEQRDAQQQLHPPAVDGRHEAQECLAHHPREPAGPGPCRGGACCTMRGGNSGPESPAPGRPRGSASARRVSDWKNHYARATPPRPAPSLALPTSLPAASSPRRRTAAAPPWFSKNVAGRGGRAHAPAGVFPGAAAGAGTERCVCSLRAAPRSLGFRTQPTWWRAVGSQKLR